MGFSGCIRDVRAGNSPSALLTNPTLQQVEVGCSSPSPSCSALPTLCPSTAKCLDLWGGHQCVCQIGYVGQTCAHVCDKFNPCGQQGVCQRLATVPGYRCSCKEGWTGPYCDEAVLSTCPLDWWGTPPSCGPCDCAIDLGFTAQCDSATGQCLCKSYYYRPSNSDQCLACDCYTIGTVDGSRSCDAVTGQCPCLDGVAGRKCDQCYSRHAEVSVRGCEMLYDQCPRTFAGNIWWEREDFGVSRPQACPGLADGWAVRYCVPNGWSEPDLFNCTRSRFISLLRQVELLENSTLQLNSFLSKTLLSDLAVATDSSSPLYGNEVQISLRLLLQVLRYENKQSGLNMTHTQDRYFIQHLVNSTSQLLSPDYQAHWTRINQATAGSAQLLGLLSEYTSRLATNMKALFMQPVDVVHNNLVLGLDYIDVSNQTMVTLPKYDTKVQPAAMFDKVTKVTIPSAIFQVSDVAVGYLLFKSLVPVLPSRYAPDLEFSNEPVVSSTVFTLRLPVESHLSSQISLQFANTSYNSKCVYWNTDQWSSQGCSMTQDLHCVCDHLTSFTVLALASGALTSQSAVQLSIAVYVCLVVSLAVLGVCCVLFFLSRGLDCNDNSIHCHLSLAYFAAYLVYITGINRTHPQAGCTLVAFLLHYLITCTLCWLFVDVLHLYRMITDIRHINSGSMRGYWVLGYGIPLVIVGLSIGLETGSYGSSGAHCWLGTDSTILWGVVCPLIAGLVLTVLLYLLGAHALYTSKHRTPRYLHLLRALPPLIITTPPGWFLSLTAVNGSQNYTQYLLCLCALVQAVTVLFGYIVFNASFRGDLHSVYCKWKQEEKGEAASSSATVRSALAYHRRSSHPATLPYLPSTASSSKTSSGLRVLDVPPVVRGPAVEDDSDSSACTEDDPPGHLASSHSSDEDDNDSLVFQQPWPSKHRPVATVLPSQAPPMLVPHPASRPRTPIDLDSVQVKVGEPRTPALAVRSSPRNYNDYYQPSHYHTHAEPIFPPTPQKASPTLFNGSPLSTVKVIGSPRSQVKVTRSTIEDEETTI